jgi:hypothetical protein
MIEWWQWSRRPGVLARFVNMDRETDAADLTTSIAQPAIIATWKQRPTGSSHIPSILKPEF